LKKKARGGGANRNLRKGKEKRQVDGWELAKIRKVHRKAVVKRKKGGTAPSSGKGKGTFLEKRVNSFRFNLIKDKKECGQLG